MKVNYSSTFLKAMMLTVLVFIWFKVRLSPLIDAQTNPYNEQ